MTTPIAAATITNTLLTGAPFTSPHPTFVVFCDRGQVRLQIEEGVNWYDLTTIDKSYARGYTIQAGGLLLVTRLEAATRYRLVPQGELSSAGASSIP